MSYLDGVSTELRAKLCSCTRPEGFTRIPEGHGEQYWVCGKCRKPRGTWHIVECINCFELYVVDEWPDKMLLCPSCKDCN